MLGTRSTIRRTAVTGALFAILVALALPLPTSEAPPAGGPVEAAGRGGVPTSCADCHADLPGSLGVPVLEFEASVHSAELVTCADCHGGDPTAPGLTDAMSPERGYLGVPDETTMNARCANCHSIAGALYRSGVHDEALGAGDPDAASCVDCHAAHRILAADNANATTHPLREGSTCGACHAAERAAYEDGVHWRRVLDDLEGATCSDCHGSHAILPAGDPASSMNPRNEAETCAACHSAAASVSGWYYGVKTDRVGTYQESYHSRALKFGDERVATCSDCHEPHDVRAAEDPLSTVSPENLPKTCGQCHATNYSTTIAQGLVHDREAAHSGELRWNLDGLSPAQQSYYLGPFDLGYWVPLFFEVLIPSVLLLLLLVVVLGNVRTYLEGKRK